MADKRTVRERICRWARRRFWAQGFSRVTMDELAGGLRISKKTLYRQFPSKERLVQALVRDFLRETETHAQEIVADADAPFVAKLRNLLRYLARQLAQFDPRFFADLEQHAPALWRELETFRRKTISTHFGRLVREGAAQGVFRRDVDSALALRVYLAAVQNVVAPRALAGLRLTARKAFESLVRLLLEGLLTEAGRKDYKRADSRGDTVTR